MTNLYASTFKHLSQKDSEVGMFGYFIGTPEFALKKLIEEASLEDDFTYQEEDEKKWESMEDLKKEVEEIILANQYQPYPTLEDDNETFCSYDDLYYGKTFRGYKLVKENITTDDISYLQNLGIIN